MGIVIIIMLGILIFIGIRIKEILIDIRDNGVFMLEELRKTIKASELTDFLCDYIGDDHEA